MSTSSMAFRFSMFITFWQSVCVSTFLHYSFLQYPYHINLRDCINFTMSYLYSSGVPRGGLGGFKPPPPKFRSCTKASRMANSAENV
jgi:hypothetical protein